MKRGWLKMAGLIRLGDCYPSHCAWGLKDCCQNRLRRKRYRVSNLRRRASSGVNEAAPSGGHQMNLHTQGLNDVAISIVGVAIVSRGESSAMGIGVAGSTA